jgi:uncharacterized protein YaaR (DUF327 family)
MKSKTISIRMPIVEANSVERSADEAGLTINSFVRSMLNREHVETSVAISALQKTIEAQREEIQEARREIAELKELVKRYTEISVQIISKLNSKLNER